METGTLIVRVYADNVAQPVEKARVTITGEGFNRTIETNASGQTEVIELAAPDETLSLTPQTEVKPYSVYTVVVEKNGLLTKTTQGVEIFAGQESIQDIFMDSSGEHNASQETVDVEEETLWNEDPAKIPEDPYTQQSKPKGLIQPLVLPFVLVPEYVIVHDGFPTTESAPNYYVKFTDYIKNVACSEIYSTWPVETIKANVYCIVSITLNRIYTEFYRSKGYDFTITSTTQYDQKYVHGRTLFQSIVAVVDQQFQKYIRYDAQPQPFLAQYNDGINTNNPGWLSQWGSKDLGDWGYTALQILTYYYGTNISIQTARLASGYPSSFPGYDLTLGACGNDVRFMQNILNVIRGSYISVPAITKPNGVYNEQTAEAVKAFQKAFNLPVTGVTDYTTWYKMSLVYVAVMKMVTGIEPRA